MKKYASSLCLLLGALAIAVGLSGCGKDSNVDLSQGVPSAPVLAPLVAPVQCAIYDIGAPLSTIPNLNLLSPTTVIGLQNLNLGQQPNDTLPFAAFVGTAAEGITKRFAMSCTLSYVAPRAGNYVFKLSGDDGHRMYLNGIQVINSPAAQAFTTHSTTQALIGAKYTIRVDYYEGDGPKGLSLTVTEPAVGPINL